MLICTDGEASDGNIAEGKYSTILCTTHLVLLRLVVDITHSWY